MKRGIGAKATESVRMLDAVGNSNMKLIDCLILGA
jgi:hypothetical protein